jgi:hypothetical protein
VLDAVVICRTAMGAETRVALAQALDAEAIERAHVEANAWIKALRQARVGAASFRDRFSYRDDSLWWFAELYLHKVGRVTLWHAAIAALSRVIALHTPASIDLATPSPTLAGIGREMARLRGVSWRGPVTLPPAWRRTFAMRWRSRYLTWTAHASRLRTRRPPAPDPRPTVAAFVHSAFWRHQADRDGDEQYVGSVLREIERRVGRERLALVGLGPRTNFRARRWWHAAIETGSLGRVVPVEALAARRDIVPSLSVWRDREAHASAMIASPDVRERSVVKGCDLWPLVSDELEGIAWMQFPWSARAMDEAGAALDYLEPSAALTYAEAGGWGRALVLEARRRAIPIAGLQHGFIYRHWLNYLHAPDEFLPSTANPRDAGFPAPTRTLLFDQFAARHLREVGHFPPERLEVTGSAGQDALLARVAGIRAAARDTRADQTEAVRWLLASLRVSATDRVLLLVTKFTQVRKVFGELVAAASALEGVRLVVKCHPAETAEPYERAGAGSPAVRIAPATTDLAALLGVARGVVTVNSTVAIDAMRLGVPAMVVDLPNNLSPFVEAGVMLGATTPGGIQRTLRRLLEDEQARATLAARQREFLAQFGGPADGQAAQRAAGAVLALAGRLDRGPAA